MSRIFSVGRTLSMIAAIFSIALMSSHFGCSGGGGQGQGQGNVESQVPNPPAAAPTVTVKLVRLDGQEMDPSAKPIPLTVSLKMTFSEAMDAPSVEGAAALMDGAGNKVPGTFAWNADNTIVTFKPQKKLLAKTTYKLQISTAAQSAAKSAMAALEQPFATMTAGDINGDGSPDLVVAAAGNPGSVYIYSGAAIANNPIAPMATIAGDLQGGVLAAGTQVAVVGDVDADGYADVLIGVPTYDSVLINDVGAAYLFSGAKLSGAQPVSKKITEADAFLFGRQLQACAFGTSISGGYDVDGDGYDDVIVGEPADNSRPGAAYVFSGKGLAGTKKGADALYIVNGGANGDRFGFAVTGLRDIDGDGRDDLMADVTNPASGKVYLFRAKDLSADTKLASAAVAFSSGAAVMFFGQAFASAGDADGDGIDDLAITTVQPWDVDLFSGKIIPATGTVNLDETKAAAAFKNLPGVIGLSIVISGAGDVDGDGRSDIVVGLPSAAVGGVPGVGKAWIYGMDANGAGKTLAELAISGAAANYAFGRSVSGIGDIDGDGRADVAISAMGANAGKGAVHIFSGANLSAGPKYTINGTTVNEVLGASLGGAYR